MTQQLACSARGWAVSRCFKSELVWVQARSAVRFVAGAGLRREWPDAVRCSVGINDRTPLQVGTFRAYRGMLPAFMVSPG
jgi:hypothetical protein